MARKVLFLAKERFFPLERRHLKGGRCVCHFFNSYHTQCAQAPIACSKKPMTKNTRPHRIFLYFEASHDWYSRLSPPFAPKRMIPTPLKLEHLRASCHETAERPPRQSEKLRLYVTKQSNGCPHRPECA